MKFARPTSANGQPLSGVASTAAAVVPDALAPSGEATTLSTAGEGRTRDAVARQILQSGPLTAAVIADRLTLSPAGVRRHLEALVADGVMREVEPRPGLAPRGRGRPARAYALTDSGRARFSHAYDDLASTALRYLRETGGEAAVTAFADHRAGQLATQLRGRVAARATSESPVQAVAVALTDEGYAANSEPAGQGVQLCQHHCPVAHVAAEFPELCEAETRALAEVLGTYVQRLATIAHGDGVCTTFVPTRGTSAPADGGDALGRATSTTLRTTAQMSQSGRQQ